MSQIVVMVEEESMQIIAHSVAQKLGLSENTVVLCHQGKSDLEASISRKLRAWRHPDRVRFIICRDNDGADCKLLKDKLDLLAKNQAHHEYKIRIVMNELESWYLGDLDALETAGVIKPGEAAKLQGKRKFRSPEKLTNAKQEFLRLVSTKGQTKLASTIGPHLGLNSNRTFSFGQFVAALQWASAL